MEAILRRRFRRVLGLPFVVMVAASPGCGGQSDDSARGTVIAAGSPGLGGASGRGGISSDARGGNRDLGTLGDILVLSSFPETGGVSATTSQPTVASGGFNGQGSSHPESGGARTGGFASNTAGTLNGGVAGVGAATSGGTAGTGGAVKGGSAGVGGTVNSGGAAAASGAAFAGASSELGYCVGKIRDSGIVPFAIGAAGSAAATDPCIPNPCKNGALCITHRERAICDCDPGTFGSRCEHTVNTIAASSWNNNYCAVLSNDSLFCWGNSPHLRTPPSGGFARVAVGNSQSCAIGKEGELVCWDERSSNQPFPTEHFMAVAIGDPRICAIRTDGTLVCWSGQEKLSAPDGVFTSVAVSTDVACGIRDNRSLTCWGGEFAGGDPPPPGTFVAVQVGGGFACALGTDGHAVCWGEIPPQGPGFPSTDIASETPDTLFESMALVGAGMCGIKLDGSVECWGVATPLAGKYQELAGHCGRRSDGSLSCADRPIPGTGAFTSVVGRSASTCAIRGNHSLACWHEAMARGENDEFGQYEGAFRSASLNGRICAISENGALSCPATGNEQPKISAQVLALAVGGSHLCAIRNDCTLECEALIDDPYGSAVAPSGSFSAIASGNDFSCGIRSDGTIACWGLNVAGQASPPLGTFVAIAAGNHYGCAIRSDGTLACWGEDKSGSTLPPAGTFEAIASDGTYNCAIRTDGTVACWGTTFALDSVPDGTFVAISAGCGITRDDLRLRCWHPVTL